MTISTEKEEKLKELFNEFGPIIRGSLDCPDDDNKIYEVYCVYKLLKWVDKKYDVTINYCGDNEVMKIKRHGGGIDKRFAYFKIIDNNDKSVNLEVHMNVEFRTLSLYLKPNGIWDIDTLNNPTTPNKFSITEKMKEISEGESENNKYYSFCHEIDIILVKDYEILRPRFDQIVLGIECKHHSVMRKNIIREMLGVRRELSIFASSKNDCKIDVIFNHKNPKKMHAVPSSLYWLAHRNANVLKHKHGPGIFDVEMKHWKLPWN